MTHVESITIGSVVVVKFPADEVVVGEVVSMNETTITLKNPMKLRDITHPQTGEPFTTISSWNRFSMDSTTDIQKSTILGISLASKRLAENVAEFIKNSLPASKPSAQRAKPFDSYENPSEEALEEMMEYVSKRRIHYFPGNDSEH